MVKLKAFNDMFIEEEIRGFLGESGADMSDDVDFEAFLRVSHYDLFCIYSLKRRIEIKVIKLSLHWFELKRGESELSFLLLVLLY